MRPQHFFMGIHFHYTRERAAFGSLCSVCEGYKVLKGRKVQAYLRVDTEISEFKKCKIVYMPLLQLKYSLRHFVFELSISLRPVIVIALSQEPIYMDSFQIWVMLYVYCKANNELIRFGGHERGQSLQGFIICLQR